jgi:hypothetical protein
MTPRSSNALLIWSPNRVFPRSPHFKMLARWQPISFLGIAPAVGQNEIVT